MSTALERSLEHDWTGVFTDPPKGQSSVVVTCCHHVDDAFYELGVVEHEVLPEQLFAFIPDEPPHDCSTAEICWMLDLRTDVGIVDDREVTAEQATALLGRDVWEALEVGRRNLAAWVEAS